MPKVELSVQCPSCKGTGVYVGMAELAGSAVVCRTCEGKGQYNYKYEYEEFTGRKKAKGVTRVYKSSYGFVIAPTKIVFKGVGEVDLSKEGISYEEFLAGKLPNHIMQLVCPMLADQAACHKIKGFVSKCHELHGTPLYGVCLTTCNHQPNKNTCWDRFLNGQQSNG